ncbi:TIGR03905 family TSCPD domain-containing protein [uncultured Clostridium sp.]|uniref:TIGR03905 family TSCPD domain-containing protein n=1 Tax=uncultured Clostridium sp. TaxID=59620 RepID=UPI0028EE04EF|nr:TIGR03905 family TSCPD domain-containing protein [uncultured Clostridium sp.]
MYTYQTSGVCARKINFDIKNNKIVSVEFIGGCNGNLKGISTLIEGMDVEEAIKKLKGLTCGNKSTSCPDQLSKALEEALNNK